MADQQHESVASLTRLLGTLRAANSNLTIGKDIPGCQSVRKHNQQIAARTITRLRKELDNYEKLLQDDQPIPEENPQDIAVKFDGPFYASIQIAGKPRHWLELSGSLWELHTGNEFDIPVKTWRKSPRRQNIQNLIPESLSIILTKE